MSKKKHNTIIFYDEKENYKEKGYNTNNEMDKELGRLVHRVNRREKTETIQVKVHGMKNMVKKLVFQR